MPSVRIFFRGLVLFQFRESAAGNRLFAFLVTDPSTLPGGPPGRPDAGQRGQDDHEAEIQIVTGQSAQQLVPQGLPLRARLDITIPGTGGVTPRRSYDNHVPRLSRIASMTNPRLAKVTPPANNPLPPNPEPADRRMNWFYIRNVITVNRGILRVKDVVIWDESGFPIVGREQGVVGDRPATAAEVKFLGVDLGGHAANECVVEVDDTDDVTIESPTHASLSGRHRSVRRRNQRAQSDSTDILIRNYEYQRERPVPWGLDFQWLFAAAGYGTVPLDPTELATFDRIASQYDANLHRDDRTSLLPTGNGRPFPYIVSGSSLTSLRPLGTVTTTPTTPSAPSATTTDIDSRPVCIPGEDDGGFG